ncbi:MAG: NUDIX domain-containing protein [Deinococcales bacterium]
MSSSEPILSKPQRTRIAAYGLILRESAKAGNQEILLCRLSPSVEGFAGYWTLPGGGIDFGEDPTDAMIREVSEETGLTVQAKSLAAVDSFCEEQTDRVLHSLRIIYHAEYLGGDLCYEHEGSTDYCAWWSYAEAKKLLLVDLAELGLRLAYTSF